MCVLLKGLTYSQKYMIKEKPQLTNKELVELYTSLNRDYIQLSKNGIEFGSNIADYQRERMNLVWTQLEKLISPKE